MKKQCSLQRIYKGLAAMVLAGLMMGPALAWAQDDVIARVVAVQGEATLMTDSSTITRGSALREGDQVNTGPDTRVRMRFIGGSLLTLGENAEFEIASYRPATDTEPQDAHFRLLSGVILAVAEGATPDAQDYRIETSAATMGIRGTIIWGDYFIEDQADFILFGGGPVDVVNDQGTVTLTEPGQGTTVFVDEEGRAVQSPEIPEFWIPGKVFEAQTTISF